MPYDPMQSAVARAEIAGRTTENVGMAIANTAAKISSIAKQKGIGKKIQTAYVDILNRFADEALQNNPHISREKAVLTARKFYPKPIEGIDPEKNLSLLLAGDVPAQKYLDNLKVERYRLETTGETPITGSEPRRRPAGSVAVQEGETQRSSAWPTSKEGMIKEAQTESMYAPSRVTSVENVPTSMERRTLAGRYGVTEAPEVRRDIQQQENVEAGTMYQPGTTKSEYLSKGAESGIDITTGAAKEIGGAAPTEYQLLKGKRDEELAQRKIELQQERNNIYRWKAAAENHKLTFDERREILDSMAKNEKNKFDTQLRIATLTKDIKEKRGKVDPSTYQPLISDEDYQSSLNELQQLNSDLYTYDELSNEFNGLLKQKGGVKAVPRGTKPIEGKRRPLSEMWK